MARFYLFRGLAERRCASLVQGLQQEALKYICGRQKADEKKSEGVGGSSANNFSKSNERADV